ncbi:hypothetical protein HBB16_13695 [Pseudonocardia sp. MCCB 268]|nr:hypothetical protein [Pseudonocardia cytotoxica]
MPVECVELVGHQSRATRLRSPARSSLFHARAIAFCVRRHRCHGAWRISVAGGANKKIQLKPLSSRSVRHSIRRRGSRVRHRGLTDVELRANRPSSITAPPARPASLVFNTTRCPGRRTFGPPLADHRRAGRVPARYLLLVDTTVSSPSETSLGDAGGCGEWGPSEAANLPRRSIAVPSGPSSRAS